MRGALTREAREARESNTNFVPDLENRRWSGVSATSNRYHSKFGSNLSRGSFIRNVEPDGISLSRSFIAV